VKETTMAKKPIPAQDEDDDKADAPKKEPKAKKEGGHIPAEGFREAVENTPAGDLDQDPREPYPTGNPPDPKEAFHRMHGHYPKEDK
jgi:hypothetical protein